MTNGIGRKAQSNALLLSLIAMTLTACGGGSADSPSTAAATQPPGSTSTTPPPDTAPSISGTPATTATVGTAYSFTPSASDANGDTLAFSITNKPAWASFSTSSGTLSGTPTAAGTAANIVISVSDGKMSTALTSFTITVSAVSTSPPPPVTGSVTLDWTPPTNNVDGSPISNLAGYTILYGNNPNSLTQTVNVPNPASTSYVVQNLTPATWYFSLVAYNSAGEDSTPSTPVSMVVQ